MNIKPLGDRVVIQKLEAETTTKSGNPSLIPGELWPQKHLKNPVSSSLFYLPSSWPQIQIWLQKLHDTSDKLKL